MRADLETVEAWRSIASYCQRAAQTVESDGYEVKWNHQSIRDLLMETSSHLEKAAYGLDTAVMLAGKPK